VASIGRRGWRQVKTSLAGEVEARLAESINALHREIAELTAILKVQVDVGNETTELLGRLLATASDRLDAVEDSLRQLTAGEATATEVPKATPDGQHRSRTAAPPGGSGEAS